MCEEMTSLGSTKSLHEHPVVSEISTSTSESTCFHLSVSLTQWAGLDSDEDAKTLPWDGPGPNRVGGFNLNPEHPSGPCFFRGRAARGRES